MINLQGTARQTLIDNAFQRVGNDLSPQTIQNMAIQAYAKSHGITDAQVGELLKLSKTNPLDDKITSLSNTDRSLIFSSEMQNGLSYIGKQDAKNIQEENPEGYSILINKGLVPYQTFVDNNKKTMIDKGIISADGTLVDLVAVGKSGMSLKDLKAYGVNLSQEDYNKAITQMQSTLPLKAGNNKEWESTILPTLPNELQTAYGNSKRTGNWDEYNDLVSKYQKDYDDFIKNEIQSDVYLNTIFITKGSEAAIKAWELRQKDLGDIRDRTLKKLEDMGFRLPDTKTEILPTGIIEPSHPNYDILSALESGVSAVTLKYVFGDEAVNRAEEVIETRKLLKDYGYKSEDAPGSFMITKYLIDNNGSLAAQNFLKKAGFSDEDISYSLAIATKPENQPSIKPLGGNWELNKIKSSIGTTAYKMEQGLLDLATTPEDRLKGLSPTNRSLVTGAKGMIVVGATLLLALPILALKVVSHPMSTPKLAFDTAKSMGLQIGTTIYSGLSGKYARDIGSFDWQPIVYDSIMTYVIAKPALGGIGNLAGKIITWVEPRGVPFGSIGKEISTGRIPTPDEFAKNYADALFKVEQEAMTKGGDYSGNVPIKNAIDTVINSGYKEPITIGEGTSALKLTKIGDNIIVKDLSGNTIIEITKNDLANISARIAKDSNTAGYTLGKVYVAAKESIPKIGDSISIAIASAKAYASDVPILLQNAYMVAKGLGTKIGDEIAFTIAEVKILGSDAPILLEKAYEQAKSLGTKIGDELAFTIANAKVQLSKLPILLDEAGTLAKSLGTKSGDEIAFAIANVKVQLSKLPIVSKELYDISQKAILDVRDASLRGISKSLLDTQGVITKSVDSLKGLPQEAIKQLSLQLIDLDGLINKVKDNVSLLTDEALKNISIKLLETEESINKVIKYAKDNAIAIEESVLRQLSLKIVETSDAINSLKNISAKAITALTDEIGFTVADAKVQLSKIPIMLDEAGKLVSSISGKIDAKIEDVLSTAISSTKAYVSDIPIILESVYSTAKGLGTKVGDEIAFTIAEIKILGSDTPIILDKAIGLAKGIGTKSGDELAFTIAKVKTDISKIPIILDNAINGAKGIGSKTGDSIAFSIAEIKTQLSKIPIIAKQIGTKVSDETAFAITEVKVQLSRLPILLDEAIQLSKNLGTKAGDELAFTITELKVQLSKIPIEAEILSKISKDGIENISDETLRRVSKSLLDTQEVINKTASSLKNIPGKVGDEIAFKITDAVEMSGRIGEYIKQISIGLEKTISGLPSEAVAGVRGSYYKIGDVLGQYTGEFKSGWEDAVAGKEQSFTFVDALKQQRDLYSYFNKYASIKNNVPNKEVINDDNSGSVPIENTQFSLRYLKTPIQQVVGDIMFHGTKDEVGANGTLVKESLLKILERNNKIDISTYPDISAFEKMKVLADQIPKDVAKIDIASIRGLNLGDATDIPKSLVDKTTEYIKSNDGKIYGSFVEWIKLKNANQPHDIDVVFKTDELAERARNFFNKLAKGEGFTSRANDRGVQILVDGEWKTFINIVSESQHASMLKGIFETQESVIDGIRVETLGSQAVMQRLGSKVGDAKSALREERLKTISDSITKIADDANLSAKLIQELNELVAGEGGIYNSPWAAIGYTRGGSNPGILMTITDSSKLQSGAEGLAKGLTESDKFIRQANEGIYSASKVWHGDLETEVLTAPETKLEVPPPQADLLTRVLTGKYADFFTYDSGKYIPIKIALDTERFNPAVVEALKNPGTWYAVKLYTLYNALRDTAEAVKHPDLVLKDLFRTGKELFNAENYLEDSGGAKGGGSLPGVRDVYLIRNWGRTLSEIMRNLFDKAFKKTKDELGKDVKESSKEFKDALDRNMEDTYKANARALVESTKDVAKIYSSDINLKDKFEKLYLANLGVMTEAIVKTYSQGDMIGRDLEYISKNSISNLPESSARNTRESFERILSSYKEPISSGQISSSESARSKTRETASESISETSRAKSSVESPISSIGSPISRSSREIQSRTIESRNIESPVRTISSSPASSGRSPIEESKQSVMRTSQEPFDKKRIMETYHGKIAWKQGKLRQGTQLREQWYVVSPPYEKVDDIDRMFSRPPNVYVVNGVGSAYATVQQLGFSPKVFMALDFGMFDLTLQTPKMKGEKPALKFQYDYSNTKLPINVKDIKTVTML